MMSLPTSYMICGLCPLTVVQEAVFASWPVRCDPDGCWREARLGLLTASPGNATCLPGTVQHVPIGSVPSDPLLSPAASLSFRLLACVNFLSSLWLCFTLHMQVFAP